MALILDDDSLLDAADGFAGWDDALVDDTLAQELEQERAAELESELEQDERQQLLLEKVDQVLESREKQIIVMRYGLYDTQPLPQREVAQKCGISRSYVSRLEKKALLKLRRALED